MDAATATLVIYLAGLGPSPHDLDRVWAYFVMFPKMTIHHTHVPLQHPLALRVRSMEVCEHLAARERARGNRHSATWTKSATEGRRTTGLLGGWGEAMDAATLYVVLTMTNGSQTTVTYNHDSMRECRAGAEFMRSVQRANPESPIVSLRCEPRRNGSYYLTCRWPTECGFVSGLTQEGCSTMRWLVHMRDRRLAAYCSLPHYKDDPEPKFERRSH